ncbi:MAG TPA: trigger factor [bacterium]|nr:trigger factor [bacterium]
MLAVETNRIDSENVEIQITVPADMVEKAVSKTFQRISQGQKIKGFRAGKVPKDVIRNMFGQEVICAESLQDLLPDVYEEALEQAGVVPISEPEFDPFPTLVEGEPMNVKAKLQVLPDFDLFDYSTIPVALDREVKIDDSEVDKSIELLRKKHADFVPLVEDRGCGESDRTTLNYKITVSGAEGEADQKDGLVITLGEKELLPDIETNIIGMKQGENKKFTVTYPENYQNPELAGKETGVEIDVTKIERRVLPEINEEFLAKVGEFKDADTLKDNIKRELTFYKSADHEEKVREQMVQKIVDGTHFDVPRKLVDDELDSRFQYMETMLGNQGMSLEDWATSQGKTTEDMREEEYHDARMTVKRRIILNKVFSQEKMDLTPAEIEMALMLYARQNNIQTVELKKLTRNRNFMMLIRDRAKEQKVIRFFRNRVKFMDDPEPSQLDASAETAKDEPAAEEAENKE